MTSNPPHIDHLILVSGPSAGGKSTLIDAFDDDRPQNWRDRLPDELGTFPHLDGNDILKRSQRITDMLPGDEHLSGLIVHYDIVHILRVKFSEDFGADPLFEILDWADRITVCDVRPDHQTLLSNFQTRQAAQQRKKGPLRVAWRKYVHAPLRARRMKRQNISHLDKETIYQDSTWLDQCYARWDQFLLQLKERHSDTQVLRLRPVTIAGQPRFEEVERV